MSTKTDSLVFICVSDRHVVPHFHLPFSKTIFLNLPLDIVSSTPGVTVIVGLANEWLSKMSRLLPLGVCMAESGDYLSGDV